MKNAAILIFLILLSPTAALPAEYWPVGIDATYQYFNEAGAFLEVTYQTNGTVISRYGGHIVDRVTEGYVEDSEGNVFLKNSMLYAEGAIDPEYGYTFDPGLKVVQSSLAVGDSWVSFCVGLGWYAPYCVATFEFEVLSEVEVTVPAGTFTALEVSFVNQSCLWYPQSGTIYLNREWGPIILPGGYKLASLNGPVAVESKPWGEVKALYR